MRIAATADLWWKNAVVYCLDVQTFADSDGDGIGDFAGLAAKVDDLAGLGVTCLWLMPFHPTADRDDGYDVTDHYAIDPRLGTFGDFTEFMAVAKDRGLRVIADLVVNHTSSEHGWFRSARRSRESPHREFYVWSDEPPRGAHPEPVFPGEQTGVWTYDTEARQYYKHRFYSHQPDLNVASAAVREEITRVMGFWLALGLSGFRVDAVPYLLEVDDVTEDMELSPHDFLRELRAFVQRRRGDAVLLGEVNLPFDEQWRYLGGDEADELTMVFDFVGMQAAYLAFARQDATPLASALRKRPLLQQKSAFATFLRNHDELTLDQLTDDEREEVFAAFGPDPDMQLYGRGLRRRLPPMFGNDTARVRLAYSLLFATPGTPTVFYGEEIGMGENLAIEGRLAVRTPMQWDDDPAGGFTTAPADAACRPFPDGEYGPAAVNVRAQRAEPESLLSWFGRMIRLRKELPEIGWGEFEVLDAGDPAVLALAVDWDGRRLLTLHNLAGRAKKARFEVPRATSLRNLLGHTETIGVRDGTARVALEAYGYRWLRVT